MSDTYRRYRAIKPAIMQFYHPRPMGHHEKHFNTLVALICGLVGGQKAHLSTIANHAPNHGADQESVIARFRRWLKHSSHTHQCWFLPVAKALLASLSQQPLLLVMDGSVVGRGCLALMVRVVYHGRALPLAWLVIKAKKGHFPQDTHCALLAHVQALLPPDADVTFLGDGEFDGIELQAALRQYQWHYVCRTASNICITAAGSDLHVAAIAPKRGELLAVEPAWMTAECYGPVAILAIWEQAYAEPLYLVTNMEDLDAAYTA